MSAVAVSHVAPPLFRPRTILVLVFVALFVFSAFAVLATYAPELRSGKDGGAHALSNSAVGYAGAVALLKARGTPVVVSRGGEPGPSHASLVILTPPPFADPDTVEHLAGRGVTLIVLPKWAAAPDPLHPGWVRNAGLLGAGKVVERMLSNLAKTSILSNRTGVASPTFSIAPGVRVIHPDGRSMDLSQLRPGPIDRLQTISGQGWAPILTDETGAMVLAVSRIFPQVYVLADPDLLNTQGLAKLPTAQVGMTIIDALRANPAGVMIDVSLNGFGRSRNVGKLMFEPPILGATICAVAAALLMGLHGLARFGPAVRTERGLALGALGLVDNSAGLIRLGRKEADLARPYATLAQAMTLQATGNSRGDPGDRLDRLERLARPSMSRGDLLAATQLVRSPADLLAVARRWRTWRLEMTRDRH